MKKNTVKLVLIMALIISTVVFMCSCSGGKSEKAEEKGGAETTTEETEEVKEEEKEEEKTLESYFDEHPDELKEIKDGVLSDEDNQAALELMDFDVYAKGNKLCYIYTFKNTYTEAEVAQMKEKFATSLDGIESDMVGRISTIEAGYGVKPVVIHIEYRNGDDSVISERDYKE